MYHEVKDLLESWNQKVRSDGTAVSNLTLIQYECIIVILSITRVNSTLFDLSRCHHVGIEFYNFSFIQSIVSQFEKFLEVLLSFNTENVISCVR